MAVLVILLSLWSPHCPHRPHIVPTSSPSPPHHPRHPHVVPKALRRSPYGHHGCGLRGLLCCLRGLHPMLSPWSPPHVVSVVPVVPMSSLSSPRHPHHPHIIPIACRRSPCGPHGCGLHGLLCCLRGLHPMLSPSFTHHPHIIPDGVGGPKSVKM